MNLREMKYLSEVAKHKHFGKAARGCFVSQPTLSMQVKKLEEYLGVKIFERTNKQVLVTDVGEKIIKRANIILEQEKQIKEIAKFSKNPLEGKFILGAFPTLASYFLPQVVNLLKAELPKLELYLLEEKTPILLEKLKEGEVDAALLALPVEHKDLSNEFLFEDPFLLAVHKNHQFASRKKVSLRDIKDAELILLEDGHCLRAQAQEICALVGAREKQSFHATSLETLRYMVASGIGITLIPKIAMRKNDEIVYVPFSDKSVSRKIGLVWRKNFTRTECIDQIKKTISLEKTA